MCCLSSLCESPIVVSIPYERLNLGSSTQETTQVNLADASLNEKQIATLKICEKPKSMLEISKALGFKERKSVNNYLRPLLERGRITMTVPDNPNSRNQRYVTIR